MKRFLFITLLALSFNVGFSQCLIQNGDFETLTSVPHVIGNVAKASGWVNGCDTGYGTPDLISTLTPNNYIKVPLDGRIGLRTPGTTAFAGMFCGLESIIGTITEPLTATNEYTVSLYIAAWGFPNPNYHPNMADPVFQVEVVLRKPNDCTTGKLVYTSGNVPILNRGDVGSPTSNWSQISGSFVLNPADVAEGYSRIEFRLAGAAHLRTGLDDICMTKRALPVADYDFVTIGQTYTNVSTPYGPLQLTQVCANANGATPVLINGGSSQNESRYGIRIEPWDPLLWTATAGPIYDNWISTTLPVPATDININSLSGNTMQAGQIYLVTLYVGSPYHSVNGLFRINPLPTLNAGADQTVCAGTPALINVTTTNWPVTVTKSGVTIGTFSSTPIIFTPTTTGAYTFTTTTSAGCSASDVVNITRITCPVPSFVFTRQCGPTATEPSFYGPIEVTTLPIGQPIIDGTATTNENGYNLGIAEFDLDSWTFGDNLYYGWYATSGQIGSLDLNTVIHTDSGNNNSGNNNFVVGQVYRVALSVASPWSTEAKFFRVSPCTRSVEPVDNGSYAADAEPIKIYPNPTSRKFTIAFSGIEVQRVIVYNMLGNVVFEQESRGASSDISVDLNDVPAGIYTVHIISGETIIQKKVVKN